MIAQTVTAEAQTVLRSRPAERNFSKQRPSLKEIRDAIPEHCFKPSNLRSLAFIAQDLILAFGLAFSAYCFIPGQNEIARWALWSVYGLFQGFIMTGIWILAHECGHQALFTQKITNDSLGFILHSMLLVPYFSWKYSHGLHHRYTNHMEKDTAFVPYRKNESGTKHERALLEALGIAEDAPALNMIKLIVHQVLGWPAYLLFNVSAGPKSLMRSDRNNSTRQSHFDPGADNFSRQQHPFVLLSDAGLALVLGALYFLGTKIGLGNVALLYGVPYLWVNSWIVAITYLHHTNPNVEHFEAKRWNFTDGSLATIDRDFGFVGKHLFHGIIEFHVVHHLFARIPFYHAEEATGYVSKVLGDSYLRVDSSFLKDLWQTFVSCRYVEEVEGADGVLVWAKS